MVPEACNENLSQIGFKTNLGGLGGDLNCAVVWSICIQISDNNAIYELILISYILPIVLMFIGIKSFPNGNNIRKSSVNYTKITDRDIL